MTRSMGRERKKLPVAPAATHAKSLQLKELQTCFHLPMAEAAKNLKVCSTVLKKICRKYGISRWPYRQIRKIDKAIIDLSSILSSDGVNEPQANGVRKKVASLKKLRSRIIAAPEHADSELLQTVLAENPAGAMREPINKSKAKKSSNQPQEPDIVTSIADMAVTSSTDAAPMVNFNTVDWTKVKTVYSSVEGEEEKGGSTKAPPDLARQDARSSSGCWRMDPGRTQLFAGEKAEWLGGDSSSCEPNPLKPPALWPMDYDKSEVGGTLQLAPIRPPPQDPELAKAQRAEAAIATARFIEMPLLGPLDIPSKYRHLDSFY
jgi:hypothetical protein